MIKIQKNKMENYLHVFLYIVKKFIQNLTSLRKDMRSLILKYYFGKYYFCRQSIQ